uniref:BTB domain-containing protein n=1 Tax=Oryzias melastigma TaxID=30732 RepID=A0A3B3CW86_ORYME
LRVNSTTAGPKMPQALMLGELCDFVIQVSDRDFKTHKIVLCNSSHYFCELFNNNPEMKVCCLPDVSANVMAVIVEYAYSQSLHVTEETTQLLMETAECFKIWRIVSDCSLILQQNICTNNCISRIILAEHIANTSLWLKVSYFILRHFEDVAKSCPDFCNLSEGHLKYFIDNSELNVREERIVFKAMLRWINYASKERCRFFPTLMSKVTIKPEHYILCTYATVSLAFCLPLGLLVPNAC